jgi:hypothetical protein
MIKSIQPLLIVFIVVAIILVGAKPYLGQFNLQFVVLSIVNFLFFVLSCVTYYMQAKAMQHKNPNVYFRSVMMSMLLKMFVTITALLIFIKKYKNALTKPTLFLTMLVYILYLAIEVNMANKNNKQKNA